METSRSVSRVLIARSMPDHRVEKINYHSATGGAITWRIKECEHLLRFQVSGFRCQVSRNIAIEAET
jgi:hypothetical protein